MAVDPGYQAILDVINSLPAPDLTRPPLDIAREMRMTPVRIPPLMNPVAVEVRKIPARDGHLIPVRIYRPATSGPHPVLIAMHGGGWVRGSLDGDEFRCHFLTHESGCAMVSVDYRMAPEYRYPTALEDCYAVTEWIAAQAESLGFDPQRMGIAGDSAGGNLATAVAIRSRDEQGPPLRCQVLTYPVCDHDFDRPSYLENAEGKMLTRDLMIWFWDQYAGNADRDQPTLSPLRAADLSRLPPTFIVTAEHDPLRDEGEAYAANLAAAGVPVTFERIAGVVHAFQSLAVTHPVSLQTLRDTAAFIRRELVEIA